VMAEMIFGIMFIVSNCTPSWMEKEEWFYVYIIVTSKYSIYIF
jgi:hypothetical protein